MTTEVKSETESLAQKQLLVELLTQAGEFEEGLNKVIQGAININMHPISIGIGCARSLVRITAAVAMAKGMDDDELKEMVFELVTSVFEDTREGYKNAMKKAEEKAAA